MDNFKEAPTLSNSKQQGTGIKAVLDQALQAYDKLPMLEIVFERLVRQLTSAFRNLTSETVDIEVSNFSSLRFGSYFKSIQPSSSSVAVFRAEEWENLGLLNLDSYLIFAFVDVLLGGKKNTVHQNRLDSTRGLTYIEQGIAKQIVELILTELSTAFEPVSPARFLFERLESNPTFATIARPGDAIILFQLNIILDGRGGKIDLVIPYNTIEPIKSQLQQVFLADRFGNDAEWKEALVNTIYKIDLPLEAVILNKPSMLYDIANLKVGDTIIMNHKHDEDVIVRCGPLNIFKGQVGKVEDKVAININKTTIEK